MRRAEGGQSFEVVAVQWGAQTQVDRLATSVLLALTLVVKAPDKCGLYHLCPAGETSWHGIAPALVQESGSLGLLTRPVPINPIPSAGWPQLVARRPLNSRLDRQRFTAAFGIHVPT